MFEHLTDRSRRVLVLAQLESRRLGDDHIGTEHLLLGLILEEEGVAAHVIDSFGIDDDAVRRVIREIIGPSGSSAPGSLPFDWQANEVLELSLREALQLGHEYIGTEHLLLGLVREREGVAALVLVALGAELTEVRRRVIDSLTGGEPRPARRAASAPGGAVTTALRALRRRSGRDDSRPPHRH